MDTHSATRVAILHGGGYVGGELLRLLLAHPLAQAVAVTSRAFAGRPVAEAHAAFRGQTDLVFTAPASLDASAFDAAFVCAEHGAGSAAVEALREAGFDGLIVDVSADHRLADASGYETWYGFTHPAPERLEEAVYGLADVFPERVAGARLVANPGCFATGLTLALWPLVGLLGAFEAHVTALTGASGSGGRPSPGTHFPSRDGNVRAYKVLSHQHLGEVGQTLGPGATVHFVPVSGPWTRGIWGTAQVALPAGVSAESVGEAFEAAYGERPLVRLSAGALPELLPTVLTPFCDVGWVVRDGHLVVGFALDNLVKGAAGQAVQNLNLALGYPEALGLLPGVAGSLKFEVVRSDAEGSCTFPPSALRPPPSALRPPPSALMLSTDTLVSPFETEDAFTLPTYAKPPVALVRGEGTTVWDTEGRAYLDFYGGHCVALLGHCPPRVVKAVQEQAGTLMFYSNAMYSPVRAEAARALVALAPEGLGHVFWCNSGTEANETALKLARATTGRPAVVAMRGGFHGRTLGALAATAGAGYRAPYASALAETRFVPFGWEGAVAEALAPGDVAAVIVEPIQSMAGVAEAPPGYYRALRDLCTASGTVLIFDEVQTGVGRTGRFTYGEHVGVTPDLITLAKSLGAGLPVGAVLVSDSIAAGVKTGDQGTTFGGGMLAMAAVSETLAQLVDDGLMARAEALFSRIQTGAEALDGVLEVRGRGGLVGIALDRPAKPVVAALRARGVLAGGSDLSNVMRLMPPLTTTDAEVDAFLEALDGALGE